MPREGKRPSTKLGSRNGFSYIPSTPPCSAERPNGRACKPQTKIKPSARKRSCSSSQSNSLIVLDVAETDGGGDTDTTLTEEEEEESSSEAYSSPARRPSRVSYDELEKIRAQQLRPSRPPISPLVRWLLLLSVLLVRSHRDARVASSARPRTEEP
eukprot:6932456-Prymnesium_polylepis.1